jgi:hypothetical protein
VVKPWLKPECALCASRSAALLGASEKIDGRTKWDMIQTVEDILGGSWEDGE